MGKNACGTNMKSWVQIPNTREKKKKEKITGAATALAN